MRTIKFRAWDFYERKMVSIGFLGIGFGASFACDDQYNEGNWSIGTEDSTRPIMQFTGLLDKNGREIYEGDILIKSTKLGKAKVFWNDRIAGFDYAWSEFSGFDTMPAPWEIIGNIYENPELLKK